MTTPTSLSLVIEAELVSDRTTKAELRRLLGEQTAMLKKLRHPVAEFKELRDNLERAQGAVQSAIQDGDSLRAQNRELHAQLMLAQQSLRDQTRMTERAQNDHQMQASNAGAFQRQYGDTLRRLEGVLDLIAHEPGEVTRITKGRS